jgi:hypothetical protein
MRRLRQGIAQLDGGWWSVPFYMALAFAAAAFTGLALMNDDADFALPMAAAAAVGCGIGAVIRVLWPRKAKEPAWPVSAAPPPGRRD